MRKLIVLLLAMALPSFGAISATMQWDVRTTGSDSNSGGFDPGVSAPGTDYSQQNSVQITYTDLVIGATTTQYTSVLNVVSSALPGNTLVITGGTGCTTGTFEVLSNATITATVDRALGTAASVCTAVLGGSKATICSAYSGGNCTAGAAAAIVTSNTIWWHSGAYTCSSALTNSACLRLSNNGGDVQVTVEGYNSTHGDYGTPPVLTVSASSTNAFYVGSNRQTFLNIKIVNTAGTSFWGLFQQNNGTHMLVYKCTFDWSGGSGGAGIYFNNGPNYLGYEVYASEFIGNSTSYGIEDAGGNNSSGWMAYNYFHGGAACLWDGNGGNSQKWTLVGNVCASTTRGVYAQSNSLDWLHLYSNSFYSQTNESVYYGGAGSEAIIASNNIFYGGTYGVRLVGGTPTIAMALNNAYGNLSVANYVNFVAALNGADVALSASPYTSPGTGNFALNGTAGGGAALKAAGFPGIAPFGTGYGSIGALQPSQAVIASGGPHAFVQ